eukprot:scaffold203534_cov92-Cyclotella_meneghiniana.AAC.1
MEPTPNNHDSGPSKRRRLDNASTPGVAHIERIIGTTTTSPLRQTPRQQPTEEDEHEEESQSQDDLPLTQDPSLLLPTASSTPAAADTAEQSVFMPVVPLDDIPKRHVSIIKEAIKDVYGFDNPRPFQIEAINHLAFNDDSSLVLIRRTADGKSLVPLTVSVLRGGVTLVLVPLHGLGSDQVDKASVPEHGIEAYYVDEHKYGNAKLLEKRLHHYSEEEAEENSILIFASPNSLREDSGWMKVFSSLAERGLIRTVAIDEAHEVEQSGKSFRKEFVEAAKSLDSMIKSMTNPVSRILMSATFRRSDYDAVTEVFEMKNVAVMQGPLARRSTKFDFLVEGDPSKSMTKAGQAHLTAHPGKQQLWYCNSRTACEGSLLDKADSIIEKHLPPAHGPSTAQSFTGGDGLKMKTSLMDAFTRFAELRGVGCINDDGTVSLPRISIMTATSAANSGVSSNDLSFATHKGFPFTLYDLVQEMGRVNRTQRMNDCHYQIHASFNCFVSAFVRIMTNSEANERKRLAKHLHDVLRLLVLPSRCYHVAIERYFEWDNHTPGVCGNMCSYCCGDTHNLTGKIHREQLEGVLTGTFMGKVSVTPDELKKAVRDARPRIFVTPTKQMGQIHAVMLQLLANDIVKLGVTDTSKVGKDKLSTKDVALVLTTTTVNGIHKPAQTVVEMYTNMSIV